MRIDGDVITGVHGVDAGWPRLLVSTTVSVSEGGFGGETPADAGNETTGVLGVDAG